MVKIDPRWNLERGTRRLAGRGFTQLWRWGGVVPGRNPPVSLNDLEQALDHLYPALVDLTRGEPHKADVPVVTHLLGHEEALATSVVGSVDLTSGTVDGRVVLGAGFKVSRAYWSLWNARHQANRLRIWEFLPGVSMLRQLGPFEASTNTERFLDLAEFVVGSCLCVMHFKDHVSIHLSDAIELFCRVVTSEDRFDLPANSERFINRWVRRWMPPVDFVEWRIALDEDLATLRRLMPAPKPSRNRPGKNAGQSPGDIIVDALRQLGPKTPKEICEALVEKLGVAKAPKYGRIRPWCRSLLRAGRVKQELDGMKRYFVPARPDATTPHVATIGSAT